MKIAVHLKGESTLSEPELLLLALEANHFHFNQQVASKTQTLGLGCVISQFIFTNKYIVHTQTVMYCNARQTHSCQPGLTNWCGGNRRYWESVCHNIARNIGAANSPRQASTFPVLHIQSNLAINEGFFTCLNIGLSLQLGSLFGPLKRPSYAFFPFLCVT